MFRRLSPFLLALFALALPLFAQEETPRKGPDPDAAKPKWRDENAWPVDYAPDGVWADYGEPSSLAATARVSLAALAAKPADFANKKIRIDGRIAGICAKAGCWLTLTEGGREIFVKFKDYAFFVPRHLAGHDVVIEGIAEVSVMTEAQRRHMAEDAGKSAEEIAAIVGDEIKLKMMADGVRIIEPDLIELGKLDAKAPSCEIGNLAGDGAARLEGTLIKATASTLTIEAAGARAEIALGDFGLDAAQLARLKAATRPIEVRVTGAMGGEGAARNFRASGVSLRFSR